MPDNTHIMRCTQQAPILLLLGLGYMLHTKLFIITFCYSIDIFFVSALFEY